MRKWQVIVAALGIAALTVGAAAAALGVLISGGSGEASEPISAPTLAVVEPRRTAQSETTAPSATPPPTVAASITASSSPNPNPTRIPSTSPVQTPTVASSGEPSGKRVLFRIIPAESRVRFEIDENLRGSPNRVVGTTDQVAGDLIVDLGSPPDSEVGTIRINVRTLRTDDSRRDRAIRSRVLQSSQDAYEFVEFTPTSLVGLPADLAVGDKFEFAIIGALAIREVSVDVEFDAVVTLETDRSLSGSATATILRKTFDLSIPSVPFVASVGEDVEIRIEFVAAAVDE